MERLDEVSVYGHTTEGWSDPDCGTSLFRDDRIVDVEFSPD